MASSKRSREFSVVKQLNYLLNKFPKRDIIRNIVRTLSNEYDTELFKKTKSIVIRQAVRILMEKYSDVDDLLLFTYLQYIMINKKKETWNVLEIENAKRFTKSNLTSEKVSISILKYFNKHWTECTVLSEKKGKYMWMVLILGGLRTEPIYCIAHMELSLVFVCNLKPEVSTLFEKVIRKTFRGSDIVQLTSIQSNADKIQCLNAKSWNILYEKISCQDEKKQTFNNMEEDVDSGEQSDGGRPDEVQSEECFENRESRAIKDSQYKVQRKTFNELDLTNLTILQSNPDRIRCLNAKSCNILYEKIPCQDEKKTTFNNMEEDVDSGEQLNGERPDEVQSEECFVSRESRTMKDLQYKVQRKILKASDIEQLTSLQSNADKIQCLNAKSCNTPNEEIAYQDEKETAFNNMEEDVDLEGQSDSGRPVESEERFENWESRAIKHLKYKVWSTALGKAVNDNFLSRNIVAFNGSNILKGLDKLIQCGIADDHLPDYLYMMPRYGEVEFEIHK